MPALIRLLGLGSSAVGYEEESSARRQMISAALRALGRIRKEGTEDQKELFDPLETFYRHRLALLEKDRDGNYQSAELESLERQRYVAQELRNVERSVAIKLRNENKIHDEVLRHLEHELDLLDARFAESE